MPVPYSKRPITPSTPGSSANTCCTLVAVSTAGIRLRSGGRPIWCKAKGEWWIANHEAHSASVTGPWPHGDRFVVGFQYDVTNKPSGKRMKMDEVGLYTVRDGKIVREEFFYDVGA